VKQTGTMVALWLTEAELDALEWLVRAGHAPSRSAALRYGMLQLARASGINPRVLDQAHDQRIEARPRGRANGAYLRARKRLRSPPRGGG
jgi:hypothetical protein